MRSHYFDNLKFVLIFLVVLVHFLGRYRDQSACATSLYLFIYLFNMPLFIFASGYFSKNFKPRVKDLVVLLGSYVLFQIAYVGYFNLLGVQDDAWSGKLTLTEPFVHNWYLLSLLGWRVIWLYARQCRYALSLSFVAAILVGFDASIDWTLSLSRTICFFPFFLIGTRVGESAIDRIIEFRRPLAFVLAGMLGGAFAIAYLLPAKANLVIWYSYYATGYSLPDQMLVGPLFRGALYALSLLSGLAVLSIVPRGKVWFTRLGERTLAVYLLHNFFTFGMKKLLPDYWPVVTECLILLFSVAVTLLLSMEWVHNAVGLVFKKGIAALELRPLPENDTNKEQE